MDSTERRQSDCARRHLVSEKVFDWMAGYLDSATKFRASILWNLVLRHERREDLRRHAEQDVGKAGDGFVAQGTNAGQLVADGTGILVQNPESYCAQKSHAESRISESHNVVTAVDIDHLAGDSGAGIGGEKDAGRAHFINIHVALQRRAVEMRFLHLAKS